MKTMTQDEFIALIQSPELWSIDTTGDGSIGKTEHEDQELVDDDVVTTTTTTCFMWGCVEARCEEIEIIYQEAASWEENHPESYTVTTDHGADVITVTGVTVLDSDGDPLAEYEVRDLFEEHAASPFTDVDWPALIPQKQYHDADEDFEMTDDTITLKRDNALDLRFNGELIAESSSSADNARGDYSGRTGRWTTLRLYVTAGGRYVCQSIGHTIWQGEHDRYSAAVCDSEAEIIQFFGTGWLAKSLYREAGIDAVETLD